MMAKLNPRYSSQELKTLTELIYPEERRHEFTREPWGGEGFRHYLDPKITCLEHFMPRGERAAGRGSAHFKSVKSVK
jgi:hypothetical protein